VFAVTWLKTKIQAAHQSRPLDERCADFVRAVKVRVLGKELLRLNDSVEMQQTMNSELGLEMQHDVNSEPMVCLVVMLALSKSSFDFTFTRFPSQGSSQAIQPLVAAQI